MSVIYDIGGTSNNCFSINGKANILQGDEDPKNIQGQNGDIYLQSIGKLWSKRNDQWQAVESSTASWPLPTKNNQLVTVSPSETGFDVSYTNATAEDFDHIAYQTKENTFTNKNTFNKQIVSTEVDFLRSVRGDYGVMFRNDGANTYILLTNQGDQYGSYNALRPFALNNSTGKLTFSTDCTFTKTIQGTSIGAYWADLAENYISDEDYPYGTLVQFGGEKQITVATTEVNAVVSKRPAVTLNNKEEGLPIALSGQTEIRIIGKVNKFDKIVLSDVKGVGKVREDLNEKVIGIALESNVLEEEKLVLCVTRMEF